MNRSWGLVILIGVGILLAELLLLSAIMNYVPVHTTAGDLATHIPMLFFSEQHGFWSESPEWYNGVWLFEFYPPGWVLFSLPLFFLSSNPLIVTYLSLVLILVLALVGCLLVAKSARINWSRGLVLFSVFMASPLMVNFVFRIGRFPEVLSWVLFVWLFAVAWYAHSRPLKWWFLCSGIIFAMMMLSHVFAALMAAVLFLAVFVVVKSWKEKVFVIASFLLGLLLSVWWWKGLFQL